MSIQSIIENVEAIKIEDSSNGSEAWIAIQVIGVRRNSKLGKEMIENGFHTDVYYKGFLYTLHGNLKEKYEKAKVLTQSLVEEYNLNPVLLDRAL